MLFFNFKLQSDVDIIHNRIYEIMDEEVSSEGFWGQKKRESGVYFKKVRKWISGYFLEDSERNGGIRSNLPLRTVFWGRLISKNNTNFFRGMIIPHPIEFAVVIAISVAIILMGGWFGVLLAVLILLFFGIGYVKLLKETKSVLEVIFK